MPTQKVNKLPIKSKKITKKERFFFYLIINHNDNVFVQKRIQKDIWQNLYQFPLIETTSFNINIQKHPFWEKTLQHQSYTITKKSKPFQQILTHQKIKAIFLEITFKEKPKHLPEDWVQINRKKVEQYAFPKIINLYLQDKSLYLF